jgi:hypothetical protein
MHNYLNSIDSVKTADGCALRFWEARSRGEQRRLRLLARQVEKTKVAYLFTV